MMIHIRTTLQQWCIVTARVHRSGLLFILIHIIHLILLVCIIFWQYYTLGQYWHRIRSRLIGNGSFVRSFVDGCGANKHAFIDDPIDPIRVPVRKRRVDAAALSHS